MSESIFVVEDEKHLAEGLRFNLEAEGYRVETFETGEEALAKLSAEVALVLLDVMLPGMDGFAVVSEMRKRGVYTPVLMLTARGRTEDVLKGFESGADDYLPKPFDLEILLARVRGLLRRSAWASSSALPQTPTNRLDLDGKTVDLERMELIDAQNNAQQLTLMETNLLRYLAERDGQTVSRSQLLEGVWGVREDTDTRAIDNFIVRLRRYIEKDPAKPRFLTTIRGVGYRFQKNPRD